MKVVRLQIPAGEPGTDETVRIIRQLIESGKRSQKIRRLAEWILARYDVPARDRLREIAAIHEWAKKNIRYVQDPYQIEHVQTPQRMLVTRTGDCDDFTALVGALVESIGYPVDIKVVAKPGRKEFHHVYPVARIGTESVGLDASMPVPLGYEAPEISRSKIYRSESNMLNVFSNMGGLGLAPLDIEIKRRGDITPIEITGGNGVRRIDPDLVTPTPEEGVGPYGPVSYLKLGESYSGADAKVRMDTRNLRPATANLILIFRPFGGRLQGGTVTAVVKNGPVVYPPPPSDEVVRLPTEGPPIKKFLEDTVVHPGAPLPVDVRIRYLKLGEKYQGWDALKRLREGSLQPATAELELVYNAYPPYSLLPGGVVTAVAKKRNGVEARYDIYGQPITTPTAPVTVTVPGVGLDLSTVAMIGGGLLLLMMFMRK